MLLERAIEFTEQLVVSSEYTLSDRERNILRGSWENLTYEAIAERYQDTFSTCNVSFIKKVLGYKLWQKITTVFIASSIINPEEKVHKLNFRAIVHEYEQRHELSLEHSSKSQIMGDRYRILSQINQTKYIKTTYLAQHLNYFNQECIIEQFGTASNSNLANLERRANILRDLSENTVCTPKLFGWFAKEGCWNLVYESVRGISLRAEFETNTERKTESEAKALLKEILKILNCIHQSNIVHRNISPDRLIRRDLDRKLILVDFEIAKYIDSDNLFFSLPNRQIDICYVAPEFITNPVFASDLYSVGKVIIQALTRLSPNEYRQNILDWHHNANISVKFRDILDKMVFEKCCHRYQSAREILNIL